MTGFVVLLLIIAAGSVALEVRHRADHRDAARLWARCIQGPFLGNQTGNSTGDADRRRIAADLQAVAQREPATRAGHPTHPTHPAPAAPVSIGARTQDAVSIRTKPSSWE